MSEEQPKRPASASPTPEAHGNRDSRGAVVSADGAGESPQDEPTGAERAPEPREASTSSTLDAQTRVKAQLEAILLAASEPLGRHIFQKCLPEEEHPYINGALEQLKLEWSGAARGVHLQEVASGFQLRTNPDWGESVRRMFESTPRKLSRAAMETLAIIAYRQPLTRAEVDELRGVDSAGVIRTLEDHELVHSVGRLDDLGRPHIWGTTPRFLEFFGLPTLDALPTLSDSELLALDEMYAEKMASEEPEEGSSKKTPDES